MNNKVLTGIIVAIVIVGGLWLIMANNDQSDTPAENGQPAADNQQTEDNPEAGQDMAENEPEGSDEGSAEGDTQTDEMDDDNSLVEGEVDARAGLEVGADVATINMAARQWEFEPSTITVKQGQTVRLVIENEDVDHGIAIPAFDVNQDLPAGQTTTVEFVADQKGEFNFVCSVYCGQGHGSMDGKVIVE